MFFKPGFECGVCTDYLTPGKSVSGGRDLTRVTRCVSTTELFCSSGLHILVPESKISYFKHWFTTSVLQEEGAKKQCSECSSIFVWCCDHARASTLLFTLAKGRGLATKCHSIRLHSPRHHGSRHASSTAINAELNEWKSWPPSRLARRMEYELVALHKNKHHFDDCTAILNAEWPRSKAARWEVEEQFTTYLVIVVKHATWYRFSFQHKCHGYSPRLDPVFYRAVQAFRVMKDVPQLLVFHEQFIGLHSEPFALFSPIFTPCVLITQFVLKYSFFLQRTTS